MDSTFLPLLQVFSPKMRLWVFKSKYILIKNIGEDSGLQIPILYGGSVNADNVLEITSEECVDGVLVGGASVRMDSFGDLLEKAVNRLH